MSAHSVKMDIVLLSIFVMYMVRSSNVRVHVIVLT